MIGIWRNIPVATKRERRLRMAARVAWVVAILPFVLVLVLRLNGTIVPTWRRAPIDFRIFGAMILPTVVAGFIGRALDRAHVTGWHALEAAQFRICPKCRYDLSGLKGIGTCPECGLTYDFDTSERMWYSYYTHHLKHAGPGFTLPTWFILADPSRRYIRGDHIPVVPSEWRPDEPKR